MQKSKLLFALTLLYCLICGAQTEITHFKNDLKTSYSFVKNIIPTVNKDTNELVIFIMDPKKVYTYKLNENFKVVDKITSENKKRKYKTILGSTLNKDDCMLFLSNSDQEKFAYVNLSFQDQTTIFQEFSLHKGDNFVQSFSYKNRFYMLAINKNSKDILLYEFNSKNKKIERNKIDEKNNFLLTKNDQVKRIADVINKYGRRIQKFEKDTPNSIESVSSLIKMYLKNNEIIVSFDENLKGTQVITINIDKKTITKKTFMNPLSKIKSFRKKSNSFIYDDIITLISGDANIFKMHILKYSSGELIQEYAISKDEEISFKNTPIIQTGGEYAKFREFEKTSKFLRKISAGNMGVSIIKNNDDYQFTIGGYVTRNSPGGAIPMMGMGAFGGIPLGSVSNVTFYFNPTMFAYNSFNTTKSTKIECLFNKHLEHIEKEERLETIFDKIKKHKVSNISHETLFKYKNFFIQGYYSKLNKSYYLIKFTQ